MVKRVNRVLRQMCDKYDLLILFAIPLVWYIVFQYIPIYGVQIAFRRFNPSLGIQGSPWIGLQYFRQFFDSYYFWDLIKTTVTLSVYQMAVGFPIPILLALIINEIRNKAFQKTIQNITYIPHFLSIVVVVSMMDLFSDPSYGLFNKVSALLGAKSVDFIAKPAYFKTMYVLSGVWQNMGFNSIVYIAALSAIDPTLYEAAIIDGASRFQKIIHISIPGILPTIVILFILRIGSIMDVGFEKVLLMQNPVNASVSEVISTFIYKNGIQKGQFSYSAAVGLCNSVINFILLVLANLISRKTTQMSLW